MTPDARPPVAPTAPPALASLARRLASVAYEALLLAAILFLVGFVLLPWVSPGAVDPARPVAIPGASARAALLAALFAAAGIYFVWSWTGARRTLPMRTWRMRIVVADGSPPGYRTALARYVAAWIGPGLALATYVAMKPSGLGGVAFVPLGLNYLAAFVDPQRQFLHDRIAGTRIVQDR